MNRLFTRRRRTRFLAAVAAGLLPAVLTGCVDDGKAVVTGHVIYHNAPVTGGNVLLYAEGNSAPFPIYIKADGSFNVSDTPTGPMRVAIETDSVPAPGDNLPPQPPGGPPSSGQINAGDMPKKIPIPPKYKDPLSSGLTWEIKRGRNNRDFTLADD